MEDSLIGKLILWFVILQLTCFDKVSINHFYSEANRVADFLVHKGHLALVFNTGLMSTTWILSIISKDALVWFSLRG